MPIGIPELVILLVIVLLIFGPKRLPMLGRQLGSGMREFRDSLTGRRRRQEEDEPGALPGGEDDGTSSPRADEAARDETAARHGQ